MLHTGHKTSLLCSHKPALARCLYELTFRFKVLQMGRKKQQQQKKGYGVVINLSLCREAPECVKRRRVTPSSLPANISGDDHFRGPRTRRSVQMSASSNPTGAKGQRLERMAGLRTADLFISQLPRSVRVSVSGGDIEKISAKSPF